MLLKPTKKLIEIVEKRAGDSFSAGEAQQLISQGADITVSIRNDSSSMIDSVMAEARRHELPSPQKAMYCQHLIQILQNRATDLLYTSILSDDGPNYEEMEKLVRLHASCYQADRFGPLGLLGELLKQNTKPIELKIVKFLIENDVHAKFALTKFDDKNQTYLSLAKKNSICKKDVKEYLQTTFDMILNKIPFENPDIDVYEVAEWIHRGANPEAIDEHQNTVLSNAVFTNNIDLVRILVAAGCNTMHLNKYKLTPIQIAKDAKPRNAKLLAILETQNTNLELKRLIETKKSQLTPNEVTILLANGASINTPITNNSTYLHLLIANEGTPEMITTFINDFNADISAMDIKGHRPIEACILFDKIPFIGLERYLKLLKISPETYFNTKLNKSILQFANEQNRPVAATVIQDALNLRLWNIMTRANTKDEHNQSLIPELKQMIDYGAQIDHKHIDTNYQQWTILHLACKTTTKSFVQSLIEILKLNYTLPNGNGDYPISIAAEHGQLSIVEYLHGLREVQLNVSNKEKQTPLHLATKNHHLLVVRYLVLWGADHQARNLSNQTPYDIARTNAAKTDTDKITDKTLTNFLQQLACPTIEKIDQKQRQSIKPTLDLDTCELVIPVSVEPLLANEKEGDEEVEVQEQDEEGEKKWSSQIINVFVKTPNDKLFDAARNGAVQDAKNAIGQGADIRHQKNNRTAYDVANTFVREFQLKMNSIVTNVEARARFQIMMNGCQQIVEDIRQIARTKLVEAIEQSNTSNAIAYLRAGAPLTIDLLYFICATTDNVQIVDYIVRQSADVRQAMIDYTIADSPYQLAIKNNHKQIASYLKYCLSVECIKSIQENNIEYVKKFVRAGASVDMQDTNNLQIAFAHNNAELIQILCDNGAKLPVQWLQSSTITLPKEITQTIDPDIVFRINRSLINRRLRFAAASGDLNTVIQCQRLSADINSENCHGSTAVLCSIQHGNYFPIVHALISHGASVLHSNTNESMSLIDLARKYNYPQIIDYLAQELNAQFLTAILNNDQKSAEKFEALGADFNCQDEQKRTALHFAVQYHGIDLVSWLCDRGSAPTKADINGNYPITEAAEKGDYAVVELLATNYPATKQQTTKSGQTALQIAQKQGFKRIAYLLEHNTTPPDSLDNEAGKDSAPKHTHEELIHAAKTGQMKMIIEFRDQQYESRDEKRTLCYQLIDFAKKAKQQEVVGVLQLYYNKELNAEIPSDIGHGDVVRLNQHHKKILFGFLVGLSRIVAESPVVLDPADPKTYTDLFSNLTSNVQKRSQELSEVQSTQDATRLSNKDIQNIDQKLVNIVGQLNDLSKERDILVGRIEDNEQQIYKQEKLTAIQKKNMFDLREENKKQLAAYDCSIFLCQREQESVSNRRHTVDFIKGNSNMFLFYRTIESRLESLFHSVLAAQGGYLKTAMKGKYSTPTPADIIPFANIILKAVKTTFAGVLSKLDEKEQKREMHNISTLGNIEELHRIASDTAGLVTLYYREQIQSIDTSNRIKGSNIFNDKIKWVKDVFIDARPEGSDEMPIIIVADYVIAWMIDALKTGRNQIIPTEPVPQQLWLCVAKKNPTEQTKTTAITDVVGVTAGRIQIALKTKGSTGKSKTILVQLRYLIGCVSVVGNNGEIYQYRVPQDYQDPELHDLEIFGYVYVTPFSNSDRTFRSIIEGRKLGHAKKDNSGNILTRFEDVIQAAQIYQGESNELASRSAMTIESADQIAQVLREKKYFLNSNDVRAELEKAQHEIKYSIDVLREDIEQKTTYYQTTIDSTREQLQVDLIQTQENLRKHNEQRYNDALTNMNEQFKNIEVRLEKQIQQRLNQMEKQLQKKSSDIQTIVDTTQTQVTKVLQQATEAEQSSKQSAQQAVQANINAQKLTESIEQRRQEFEQTTEKCQTDVKRTVTELKQMFEKTISEVRSKLERDFQRAKQAAEESATNAKESSRSAKESTSITRDSQKQIKEQNDLHNKETEKLMGEIKDIKKQNERLVADAKEAGGLAKQSAQQATQANVNAQKLTEAIEQRRQELEQTTEKCQNDVKQTVTDLKRSFEKHISELRKKTERDVSVLVKKSTSLLHDSQKQNERLNGDINRSSPKRANQKLEIVNEKKGEIDNDDYSSF